MTTTQEIIDMLVEKLGEEDFLELADYLYDKELEENPEEFLSAVSRKAENARNHYNLQDLEKFGIYGKLRICRIAGFLGKREKP